jgi:YD repeat-containing protein
VRDRRRHDLAAQHRSSSDRYYTYDAYGNMTSSAVVLGGTTSYTHDGANHVASIVPPAGSSLSFTVDALGRQRTKSAGGTHQRRCSRLAVARPARQRRRRPGLDRLLGLGCLPLRRLRPHHRPPRRTLS